MKFAERNILPPGAVGSGLEVARADRRSDQRDTARSSDDPSVAALFVMDNHRPQRRLKQLLAAWAVKSENFTSIHNHSAYAEISGVNA